MNVEIIAECNVATFSSRMNHQKASFCLFKTKLVLSLKNYNSIYRDKMNCSSMIVAIGTYMFENIPYIV